MFDLLMINLFKMVKGKATIFFLIQLPSLHNIYYEKLNAEKEMLSHNKSILLTLRQQFKF